MEPVIYAYAVYHNQTPAALYELFMDSAKHTAATGSPAKISSEVGGEWSAFDGMIYGRNLEIVPNRRVVQTWHSTEWKKTDLDSILVAYFEKSASGGGQVELAHIGVPKYDWKGVAQGWIKFYWEPWRAYIKAMKAAKRKG